MSQNINTSLRQRFTDDLSTVAKKGLHRLFYTYPSVNFSLTKNKQVSFDFVIIIIIQWVFLAETIPLAKMLPLI